MRVWKRQALVGAALVLMACAAEVGSGEIGSGEIGSGEMGSGEMGQGEVGNGEVIDLDSMAEAEVAVLAQEITNGTPTSVSDVATVLGDAFGGYIALSYNKNNGQERFFCSGTLLYNNIAISAKHCFTHDTTEFLIDQPHRIRVTMGRNSYFQERDVQAVSLHNSEDLAFILLSSGFTMLRNSGGLSTTGYSRPFYFGPADELDGAGVTCWAHGANWYGNCPAGGPATECDISGQGNLRFGDFVLDYRSGANRYEIKRNNLNQSILFGDSGGACVDYGVTHFGLRPDQAPIYGVISSGFIGGTGSLEPFAYGVLWGGSWTQVIP